MDINYLQEIWEKFIDVQEQLLRLRSVPISIIPDSAKIVGEKLFLTVNENDTSDAIIEEIASVFNLSSTEINIKDGYFLVDTIISQNVSTESKNHLSERAANNFINFIPFPVIDGFVKKNESPLEKVHFLLKQFEIDYLFDINGKLQVTISDLKKIENIFSTEGINIIIPETATIILTISPNPVYFLSKEYPGLKIIHKTIKTRKKDKNIAKKDQEIRWKKTIEVFNGCFSAVDFQKLNKEIGLYLLRYDYIFFVNPNVISKYNPENSPFGLPKINSENNSFTFQKNPNSSIEKDERSINKTYDIEELKKSFDFLFGSENVMFESKFIYTYDLNIFRKGYLLKKEYLKSELWEKIQQSFINEKNSLNEKGNNLRVKFNWKIDKIEDIIFNLSSKCDFINLNFFKNHRCNIDFQIKDMSLDEAENLLREKFPSIKTNRDDKKGTLRFYQEYQNSEQGLRLKEIIVSELKALSSNTFNYELTHIPTDKEKYILEIDIQSKKESQSSAIKELRGADFCFGKNYFGKLLRVNYPEMIFDISGIEFEKTKHLFESHSVNSIEPNLTGDLEKIFRLKNSFNNI
jgi:hypothetical protein